MASHYFYSGMLHACVSHNIEAIKLITADSRYNLEKHFTRRITATHLKSARISNINLETYCLGVNEIKGTSETVRYLLDTVCITSPILSVDLKFAVFYKYTDMIKKILATPQTKNEINNYSFMINDELNIFLTEQKIRRENNWRKRKRERERERERKRKRKRKCLGYGPFTS
jgi:hypothetical protein